MPDGACFSLQKVDTVFFPHPYCITSKHVVWASDHHSDILDADAIRESEKHGAKCDTCRRLMPVSGASILSYDEHEKSVTLFVWVPNNKVDLNSIPGLKEWLCENKPAMEAAGIQGFAFPDAYSNN